MQTLKLIIQLARLNKPIGIFLLLWPALWALWIAAHGFPGWPIFMVFVLGVITMRSAGCVINDIADRDFDKHVKRTQHRPITSGKVSLKLAYSVFFIFVLCAFVLVCTLNRLTIYLSFVGLFLGAIYPFMKRITHWPQFFLGLAFAWAVPMSFAAVTNELPVVCWVLFAAAVIWPLMYDTQYAMVDRPDDVKIGVKSTAILFGGADRLMIALLQLLFLLLMGLVGWLEKLSGGYYVGLVLALLLFGWQQFLIRQRVPEACFKAFLNNNWVGLAIFFGLLIARM